MKYWQLHSLARERQELLRVVLSKPEWAEFADWPSRATRNDREVLDAEIPDELARDVLSRFDWKYVVRGKHLRRLREDRGDRACFRNVMTAVEAFDRFGGAALEDVEEKGSIPLKWIESSKDD